MATSFSALKLYNQCALKYRIERIMKMTPPADAVNATAANRGSLLHEVLEGYILGTVDQLPIELLRFKSELDRLKLSSATTPELKVAVDADRNPVDFDSPDALFRGVIDVITLEPGRRRAHIRDWKSGKIRVYDDQLRFYAMLALCAYPDIDRVDTDIGFIDAGKLSKGPVVVRAELEPLWQYQLRLLDIIARDRVYAPNPSSLCAFCPWQKKKGGPCKF